MLMKSDSHQAYIEVMFQRPHTCGHVEYIRYYISYIPCILCQIITGEEVTGTTVLL